MIIKTNKAGKGTTLINAQIRRTGTYTYLHSLSAINDTSCDVIQC